MRVVAGEAGGRPLRAPDGRRVRPTSERVREALFNALGSLDALDGAKVLDLFAGTGALGIEALSRGAASAVFVDADPESVRAVKDNLAATKLGERAKVVQADACRYLSDTAPGADIDLAFADPPYSFDDWPRVLGLLASVPVRLVALEARTHLDLGEAWLPIRSKRYGDTVVTLARREEG